MLIKLMFNFSAIFTDLQAAIAVVAARERRLAVLLVAVWGRIARMRTRLERLIAQWRAGTLPKPRGKQVRRGEGRSGRGERRLRRVRPRRPAMLS